MKITKINESRLPQADFSNLVFGTQFSDHMLVCHYRNGAWEEAEIKPYGPFSFTPAMHTLHYGQAIFEGQKAYHREDGKVGIFRLEKNAERLNNSARRMFMPEYPVQDFVAGVKTLIDLDRGWVPDDLESSLYIRPFMFGSSEFVAARPSENFTLCVITSPVGPYYAGNVKVKVEERYTRSATGGVGATKCAGNYAGAFLPTDEAKKQGYTQVIWTDHASHELVEESGTMNIGFIIDKTFVTPPLSDRILPGITRNSILQMLRAEGDLQVEERPIKVPEVIEAAQGGRLKEAFGMGTAAVISPISTIGYRGTDYEIPTPEAGHGMRIKKTLTDIRQGRREDPYGWMTLL